MPLMADHNDAAAAVLTGAVKQLLPDVFDLRGILADNQRCKLMLNDVFRAFGRAAEEGGFAEPLQSGICFHLYQNRAARGKIVLSVGNAVFILVAQDHCRNLFNFHFILPPAFFNASSTAETHALPVE